MNPRPLFALLVLLTTACGGTTVNTCGPSTCDGCCDETGICRAGSHHGACGESGETCDACSVLEACVNARCVTSPGTAGGAGGGGAIDAESGGGAGGGGELSNGGGGGGGGSAVADAGSGGAGGGMVSMSTYPAPHGAFPHIVAQGGPVMSHPKFYAINFHNQAANVISGIDDMMSTVGGTAYWTAATSEYGVGPATAAPPIHLGGTAPGSISDGQIQAWLAIKLDGTHPEFGNPDANTLYVIFYPPGTTISMGGGSSCGDFEGYHSHFRLGGGQRVAYAVIAPCDDGIGVLQTATSTASHELVEAATDPYIFDAPAYLFVDDDHLVWEVLHSDELGDLCAFDDDSYFKPAGYMWTLQRSWSNAAAQAGHDPCQPSLPSEVYFAAVPQLADAVTINWSGQTFPSKGVRLAVGGTKTVGVDLFSDGAMAAWTVSASDLGANDLTFTFDRTSGANGERVNLTIKRNRANAKYGATPFAVVATSGQTKHAFYGVVGQ